MSQKISNPRGTADILPDQIPAWERLETLSRNILKTYGYREIRTPLFEEVGLFKRSLGETTEVVNKQLLEVRSQRSDDEEAGFALRPEGTAPVVRSYNQFNQGREEFLSKLFYIAPMFRGERPQKGRLRQFHQIGAEAIGRGANHPLLDAEMIALAVELLKAFGLEQGSFTLKLNSLGSAEDKAKFAGWLRQELKGKIDHLSEDCRNQYERNVFRLLDSKDKDCQTVIQGLNIGTRHLSESGLKYFDQVRQGLDHLGIRYEVSANLVRGLDYYTHTVFEISYAGLGAQDAIGAGGRYNGLIEQLGGGDPRLPGQTGAIGFALGMERILLALEHQGKSAAFKRSIEVFVVTGKAEYEAQAFGLLHSLRQAAISADMDFGGGRAFKKQFEQADKLGARFVLVLGEAEIQNSTVALKNMATGVQTSVAVGQVVEELRKHLK
ncbi:MAG: histidine--tRNA ligase [Candidatus Omnitrophica bacterium]|nr:histidine--tRNA ligase [Candidatus Omnitrophota bacterium]